jgi:hypothetical protein
MFRQNLFNKIEYLKYICMPVSFLTVALAFLSCGAGPDNVAACKRYASALKCGSMDLSSSVNCSQFDNTTCDISSYFDCSASYFVCKNGMFDSARFATASQCASKAVCK